MDNETHTGRPLRRPNIRSRGPVRGGLDFIGVFSVSMLLVLLYTVAMYAEPGWITPLTIGAVFILAGIFAVAARTMRRDAHRETPGDDDPRLRRVQIFAISGAFALVAMGRTILQLSEDRFDATDLPPAWGAVGGSFVGLGFALLLAGLLLAPSSARELTRRIHLEASTATLGFIFLGALVYGSLPEITSLPELTAGVMMGAIASTYLVTRLILTIRYSR